LTLESGEKRAGPLSKGFIAIFGCLFSLTVVLAAASFPVGVYTVLFTTLTQGQSPLTLVSFFFWVGPIPVQSPLPLPVGVLFVTMVAAYILMLAFAATRKPGAINTLASGMRRGLSGIMANDLVVVIVSIGFLSFSASVIDALVQGAGVQIGALQGTDLDVFVSAATSPLIEELGFRVCIIGLVALLLSLGKPVRDALGSLWRPARAYEGEEVRTGKVFVLWVALLVSSVTFGILHISSGAGWQIGKFPEATFGGLVLGYVYLRYGLHVAVLTHWGIDYLGTVFSFFGQGAYGIPWTSDPGYVLQRLTTVNLSWGCPGNGNFCPVEIGLPLAGIGLCSFVLVLYLGLERFRTKGSPPSTFNASS
jgi:hypothetical protein